jgi:hypothetical protein
MLHKKSIVKLVRNDGIAAHPSGPFGRACFTIKTEPASLRPDGGNSN